MLVWYFMTRSCYSPIGFINASCPSQLSPSDTLLGFPYTAGNAGMCRERVQLRSPGQGSMPDPYGSSPICPWKSATAKLVKTSTCRKRCCFKEAYLPWAEYLLNITDRKYISSGKWLSKNIVAWTLPLMEKWDFFSPRPTPAVPTWVKGGTGDN